MFSDNCHVLTMDNFAGYHCKGDIYLPKRIVTKCDLFFLKKSCDVLLSSISYTAVLVFVCIFNILVHPPVYLCLNIN